MTLDDVTNDPRFFEPTNKGRDDCFPLFKWEARQNNKRSQEEGRPIFDQVAFVEIRIPCDNKNIVYRKVNEDDKRRWPSQWDAFLRKEDAPAEGTPLEQWPALSVTQVAELKALNIRTIEALAHLTDTGLQKLGLGARDLQRRAKAFLRTAQDDSFVYATMEEVEVLKERVGQLEAENEELRANQRRKPGRPKKVTENDAADDMPERGS